MYSVYRGPSFLYLKKVCCTPLRTIDKSVLVSDDDRLGCRSHFTAWNNKLTDETTCPKIGKKIPMSCVYRRATSEALWSYSWVTVEACFNLAPRSELWPPGVKLAHKGEPWPLGVKLAPGGEDPLFTPPFFKSRPLGRTLTIRGEVGP
jgi:hypothetical protein